jgi:regulator of protease activity HflC (stomatin/prohibitin superfamily)
VPAVVISVIVVILLLILLRMSIKVLREYERGVVFRFGRLRGIRGPGIFAIFPFVDRMGKSVFISAAKFFHAAILV